MRLDRDKLRKNLLRQTERSYTSRDSFSGKSIFKPGLDIQFWNCKEGTHIIDILPYQAGKNNPHARPGEFTYLLDVWVHYGVGPNDDQYICLAKTYGQRCPICEYRKEQAKKGEEVDKEELDALKPRRRTIYAIICYDTKEEEDKGVQIWEVAHFFMERHLSELSKNPRKGGFILFSSPWKEEGKSIQFTKRGRGAGNVEFIGHKFLDRDYDIPSELLEQVPCLDELIHIPTYEEVHEAFFGKPSRLQESERRQVVEEEGEVVEEELAEERPARRRPSSRSRAVKEESIPTDELTESIEETESSVPTCPGGGVFGRDTDELDYCVECELYDDCLDEFERREEKRRKVQKRRFRK